MSEPRRPVGRERYAPGQPAPGVDYEAALGVSAETRADMDIAGIATERLASQAAEKMAPAGLGADDLARFASLIGREMAAAVSEAVALNTPVHERRMAVPPAVQKHRAETWEKMKAALASYNESGEKLTYELLEPLFCDDVLIPATRQEGRETVRTRINYRFIPNEHMAPLSPAAKQVHALYLEAIGGKTPALAESSYQAYLNRPRIAQVEGAPLETQVMGSPGALHEARAEILENTPLEERTYVGPQKQLGTLIPEIPGAI